MYNADVVHSWEFKSLKAHLCSEATVPLSGISVSLLDRLRANISRAALVLKQSKENMIKLVRLVKAKQQYYCS